MGQKPVCSFCSENEGDKNDIKFQQPETKIIVSKEQSLPNNNNIILKEQNNPDSFNLTYIGGYTTAIKEGFNIMRWENNC
jgi:hypothetical protein